VRNLASTSTQKIVMMPDPVISGVTSIQYKPALPKPERGFSAEWQNRRELPVVKDTNLVYQSGIQPYRDERARDESA
jgi:hypothetical protein